MYEKLNKYLLLKPISLIDVGSRGGVQKKWLIFKNNLDVIGFEPDNGEYNNLKKNDFPGTIYNIGLWKEKGNIEFNLTRVGRCSSILEPDREVLNEFPDLDRFDVVKKTNISVDTLDNILNLSNQLENEVFPDFIKLDTQGTELSILQGMKRTLNRSIFGIEIEVNFLPMYANQPLFNEIDQFLHNRGFQLFDIKKHYWKRKCGLGFDGSMKGQIAHGDALYFRKPDIYVNILKNMNDSCRVRLLKSVAIALFFGYSDYSISLLKAGIVSKIITDDEYTLISDNIFSMAKKNTSIYWDLLPDFRGKWRISNIISRID